MGVNPPVKLEIPVPEPLADYTVTEWLEPFRRQRHDKYSSRTDRSADYYHPISCVLLRQRAYDRRQEDNDPRVDRGNFSDGRVQPKLANAELRKHIIHLQ